MLESRFIRAVGVLFLLMILFGLLIGFGTLSPAPNLGSYPSASALAADYDAHVNQLVQVSGTVVQTDPVVIAADYDYYADGEAHSGTVNLSITGMATSVKLGQFVQVFGVAHSDRTIAARTVVTTPAINRAYMYGVSALAGLWVLARLVRDWRINWQTGALRRREQPLALNEPVTSRLREVRE